MNHIMSIRKTFLAVMVAVMVLGLAFAAIPAKAANDTFKVTVVHGINGRSLGLSKELPVNVEVWKDGAVLAHIKDFTFKERFAAELPAGTYQIRVYSVELKAYVTSMDLGPVEIPGGANLLIRAKLSGGTPILAVKAR